MQITIDNAIEMLAELVASYGFVDPITYLHSITAAKKLLNKLAPETLKATQQKFTEEFDE